MLIKIKEDLTPGILASVLEVYNKSYHSAIKCTPNEAWFKCDGNAAVQNSNQGTYKNQFKRGFREKFEIGERIRIAQKENIKGDETKQKRGRFLREGVVIGNCNNDSYLVKDSAGKIFKKRHYDLKRIYADENDFEIETTRLEEGDVIY